MNKFFVLFAIAAIVYASCTDPINIGTDLVEQDGTIGVDVTNTFSIEADLVVGDSTITFRKLESNTYFASTFMVGVMENDTFGRSESTTYFDATLQQPMPDLSDRPIDSVVMVIYLDSLGQYGDASAIHNLELFRLIDNIPAESNSDTLYSNLELAHESTPLTSLSQVVNHFDSIQLNAYVEDTVVLRRPQLRFTLDKQFWIDNAEAFADSTDFADNFSSVSKGFAIKSTPDNSSMIGMDLLYGATTTDQSTIDIYYEPTDTTRSIYSIRLARLRHSYFENDYSGSILNDQLSLDDPEFLFLESQAGAYLEFDLSALDTIQDKILNYAGIEMFLAQEGNTDPINQLFAFYEDDDGNLVNIADLRGGSVAIFDGALSTETINGVNWSKYKMNLTNQVNSFIDKDITTGKIFVLPEIRAQRPERAFILGPGNNEQPPVLQLVLSNP